MTFSLLAADPAGAIGMVTASSSPAVAARCIHLRSHVGGVGSQNVTDPRLGGRLLDAIAAGATARTALDGLLAGRDPTLEYRQLLVADAAGGTAVHSGSKTLGRHGAAERDGAVAAGNLLADERVPAAMVEAFEKHAGQLEERLLAALRAGREAGGEEGDVRSCGLGVVRDAGWRETDLRVDWHSDPIGELERILAIWLPQRDDYVTRGLDPRTAPSYGVPGDR